MKDLELLGSLILLGWFAWAMILGYLWAKR